MSFSDVELVASMAAGDRAAFGLFFDRHAPRILGLLVKLLGGRGDADDVLQETFWQVWLQAGRYHERRSQPGSWVVLIARSRAMDHLRRKRVREARVISGERAIDDAAGADCLLDHQDWKRHASAALLELPREQGALIGLAFYEGWTHEEIAERTALPLGTVKTRIRRGLMSLKESLGAELARPCP